MKRLGIVAIFILFIMAGPAFGYWIWTPESGRWENPKFAAKDTPEDQLAYAQKFYEAKNLKDSLKEFKKLLRVYPLSKEAPTAQYYVGRIMEANNYGHFEKELSLTPFFP